MMARQSMLSLGPVSIVTIYEETAMQFPTILTLALVYVKVNGIGMSDWHCQGCDIAGPLIDGAASMGQCR
jgi:hypothetical protein